MVHNRAGQDHVINVAKQLIDPNRRAAACVAEIFKIVLIGGDAVMHLDARGNFFADLFNHLLVSHHTVRAQREDDTHIFVRDTQAIHLIDENRHKVVAVGNARRVIANKGYGITGLYDFRQRRRSDRVGNRIQNPLLDVLHRREIFRTNNLQNIVFFIIKGLRAVTVGKGKLLERHKMSFLKSFEQQSIILTRLSSFSTQTP